MKLAEIYSAPNGEQPFLGKPAIFLRLGGCHLRCYKRTLGVLCDTPDFLAKDSGEEVSPSEIAERVRILSQYTGIYNVTLTGGEPLWRDENDLLLLFEELHIAGMNVNVETSGTLSIARWIKERPSVSFVVDYKGKSAGLKNLEKVCVFRGRDEGKLLRGKDTVKFVIYSEEDFAEAVLAIPTIWSTCAAKIVIGTYWQGRITNAELYEKCLHAGLFKYGVEMNYQLHKLTWSIDFPGKPIPNNEI